MVGLGLIISICVATAGPKNATKSSRAVEWGVPKVEYERAQAAAAEAGYAGVVPIEFLLAKGLLSCDPASGARCVDLIVSDSDQHWDDRWQALCDIVGVPSGSESELGSFKAIPDDISFTQFVKDHPEWGSGVSWVFFRDHPRVKDKEHIAIERAQTFGSCSIHAAVALQHYLVAMHTDGEVTKTLDMSRWLRRYASVGILEDILFGKGAVPSAILQAILRPGPDGRVKRLNGWWGDFPMLMKKHGPGLVQFWRGAKINVPGHQHLPDDGNDCHAMLVVGYRELENGERRVLLQNWWRGNQFVEADRTYFDDCWFGSTHFVETEQPHFPEPYDLDSRPFVVSAADGAGVADPELPCSRRSGKVLA